MKIEVECVQGNGNTGKVQCPINKGLTKGFLRAPVGNKKIPKSARLTQDTLEEYINDQLHHADPGLRWHSLSPLEDMQWAGTDKSVFTYPNGRQTVVSDSQIGYTFQFARGGKQYHQAQRSFNGLDEAFVVFEVDINNVIHGTQDEDNADDMTGYTTTVFHIDVEKNPTFTNPVERMGTIFYADVAEHDARYFAVKADFDPLAIKNVIDLEIVDVTPAGAADGVHHIQLKSGGNFNIIPSIGSAAALSANFNWVSPAGAAISFSSALSGDGKSVVATATLSDADYVDGQQTVFSLKASDILATNGLKWYEGKDPVYLEAREA